MDLVCGLRVPNNKLAILRCGDKMSLVGSPMHSVDFGKMTWDEGEKK